MKIETHPNLTVSLLHDRLFGLGRFDVHAGARVSNAAQQLHSADRARVSPPTVRVVPGHQVQGASHCQTNQDWHYDTPLPSGLPRLPDHAGRLDIILPGAVGVVPLGAQPVPISNEIHRFLAGTEHFSRSPVTGVDTVGAFIDLWV